MTADAFTTRDPARAASLPAAVFVAVATVTSCAAGIAAFVGGGTVAATAFSAFSFVAALTVVYQHVLGPALRQRRENHAREEGGPPTKSWLGKVGLVTPADGIPSLVFPCSTQSTIPPGGASTLPKVYPSSCRLACALRAVAITHT